MSSKVEEHIALGYLQSKRGFYLFALFLFTFLFVYLFIRAIYNEPIQDEIVTFTNYIQSKLPHNGDIAMDANNHLLNTYLANMVFYFSGSSHFFWMRLPNLLSFPLYFFSIYQIVKQLQNGALRYTGLIALTCIPFLIEYFAYCRGYGLSFALLAFAFLQLMSFLENSSRSAFAFGIIAVLLATWANLGLMPLCLFIFGYFILTSYSRKFAGFLYVFKFRILPSLMFLAGLDYILEYSFQLKKVGALYWGGQAGLWGTTGSSLSEFILFQTSILWKYIVIAILILFGIHIVLLLVRYKSQAFRRFDFAFIVLLFGLIVFIQCCFTVLGINFPIDRGGLHLALLFLICLIFVLDYYKVGKILHWSFLIFSLLFSSHLSIHSSVYSPGDRITNKLYAQILPHLGPKTSIYCNTHLLRSFWYQERQNGQFYMVTPGLTQPKYSDIWICRTDFHPKPSLENYELIAENEATLTKVYKRKKANKSILLKAGSVNGEIVQDPVLKLFPLIDFTMKQPLSDGSLDLELTGHFTSPTATTNLELTLGGFDENGTCVYFAAHNLRIRLQDLKLNGDFHTTITLEDVSGSPIRFGVYLASKTLEPLAISKFKYKISKIEY